MDEAFFKIKYGYPTIPGNPNIFTNDIVDYIPRFNFIEPDNENIFESAAPPKLDGAKPLFLGPPPVGWLT